MITIVLSAPNFVGSFTFGDFVYFFFRETAVEFINCGKVCCHQLSFNKTFHLIPRRLFTVEWRESANGIREDRTASVIDGRPSWSHDSTVPFPANFHFTSMKSVSFKSVADRRVTFNFEFPTQYVFRVVQRSGGRRLRQHKLPFDLWCL